MPLAAIRRSSHRSNLLSSKAILTSLISECALQELVQLPLLYPSLLIHRLSVGFTNKVLNSHFRWRKPKSWLKVRYNMANTVSLYMPWETMCCLTWFGFSRADPGLRFLADSLCDARILSFLWNAFSSYSLSLDILDVLLTNLMAASDSTNKIICH